MSVNKDSRTVNIGVVGCGAIAESVHLPCIQKTSSLNCCALVDIVHERATALASRYGVPHVANTCRSFKGIIDAAVIAGPPNTHAETAIELLNQGIHVLVEKPMAMTVRECDDMIRAAESNGCTLAVAQTLRFLPLAVFVKEFISMGCLGKIRSFDLRSGGVYSWPVKDIAMLRPEAGGGVLNGVAPHGLDMLLWWLGSPEEIEYYDDSMGGAEANCLLHFSLSTGARGVAEFSRTRRLRNSFLLRGDLGELEISAGLDSGATLRLNGHTIKLLQDGNLENLQTAFQNQINDFADSVAMQRSPRVPGPEGKKVVSLLETCRNSRRPMREPWLFSGTLLQKETVCAGQETDRFWAALCDRKFSASGEQYGLQLSNVNT